MLGIEGLGAGQLPQPIDAVDDQRMGREETLGARLEGS